jgi:hypothetical protein
LGGRGTNGGSKFNGIGTGETSLAVDDDDDEASN